MRKSAAKTGYSEFLREHRLSSHYIESALSTFRAVIDDVITSRGRVKVLGVNGCQGSGKTTLAAFLQRLFENEYKMTVVVVSLDDFYYSRAERMRLAERVHPLLATRGVPGTHDLGLAIRTISDLKSGLVPVLVPRFDKGCDDLFPKDQWRRVESPVHLVIFEGWCLGAKAQPEEELKDPVNLLEREEDPDGIWRRYVNMQLHDGYQRLFSLVDRWVMLKAPDFAAVYKWRLQQEEKLRAQLRDDNLRKGETGCSPGKAGMSQQELARFVQFFERLTVAQLKNSPEYMDHVYELDEQRVVIRETHRIHPEGGTPERT